jgi:hypothetical protein
MSGGTTSRGRCLTVGVLGRYSMSSATSSRSMTSPGVTARSTPTVKALRSVCDGIPPLCRTSWGSWRAPRRRLAPAVSNARLRTAGLPGSLQHAHREPGAFDVVPVLGGLLVLVDEPMHLLGCAFSHIEEPIPVPGAVRGQV